MRLFWLLNIKYAILDKENNELLLNIFMLKGCCCHVLDIQIIEFYLWVDGESERTKTISEWKRSQIITLTVDIMIYATVVQDYIEFIELDDDNLLGEWSNTPITKSVSTD